MKKFGLTLIFLVLTIASVFAQVGGNDWTPITGQSFTSTYPDGSTHTRTLNYSPSTLKRSGDIGSVTLDTVFTDNKPTVFYQVQINCRTHQYTFAAYDLTTNPATLLPASEWKNPQPNSPFPATEAIVCK